jgi:hypothetical protein
MDTLITILMVSALTIIVTLAVAIKLNAWRDRQMFWLLIRDALGARSNVVIGIIGMLIYLVTYLVLGNHIHYFYGRVIWTGTFAETTLAIISALLVGLVFALFPYSLKKLGIIKSQKGGWGVIGTIIAVIVSFCP